jgi:hypothetical protein
MGHRMKAQRSVKVWHLGIVIMPITAAEWAKAMKIIMGQL